MFCWLANKFFLILLLFLHNILSISYFSNQRRLRVTLWLSHQLVGWWCEYMRRWLSNQPRSLVYYSYVPPQDKGEDATGGISSYVPPHDKGKDATSTSIGPSSIMSLHLQVRQKHCKKYITCLFPVPPVLKHPRFSSSLVGVYSHHHV
jgi:hypothetical protein